MNKRLVNIACIAALGILSFACSLGLEGKSLPEGTTFKLLAQFEVTPDDQQNWHLEGGTLVYPGDLEKQVQWCLNVQDREGNLEEVCGGVGQGVVYEVHDYVKLNSVTVKTEEVSQTLDCFGVVINRAILLNRIPFPDPEKNVLGSLEVLRCGDLMRKAAPPESLY